MMRRKYFYWFVLLLFLGVPVVFILYQSVFLSRLVGGDYFQEYSDLEAKKMEVLGRSDLRKEINQHSLFTVGKRRDDKVVKQVLVTNSPKILFLGDLMLDRQNRILLDRKGAGFFTEKIEHLFWGQDLNIANLEGPITTRSSLSVGQPVENPNHFRFTFKPRETINFLQANRINLVNLGNNHILNFGSKGLEQTEEVLTKNNIDYFGDPLDLTRMSIVKRVGEWRIGFVNYNQFVGFSSEQVVEIIKSLKTKSDFVIVYSHWGEEYKLVNNARQQQLAHQFIEAGADLIVGSHPHVVQSIEVYRGKAIFYSLGNFVFDQYFSKDVRSELALLLTIKNGRFEFTLLPLFRQNNGQLVLMEGAQRKDFLAGLAERSSLEKEIKKEIKEGVFILSGKKIKD